MILNSTLLSRWSMWAGQSALLLAMAACAQSPVTTSVAIPPVPTGEARVWFYRDYEPYAGKGLPAVAMNGGVVGAAELGGAFYRDVPPGHYTVTVETNGRDLNQMADFDVGPGQEAYVKIVSSPDWVSGGDSFQYERPTFYAWRMPSEAARTAIAHLAFNGGS